MKSKQPFYNRVTHRHDIAKQRYAELNFPINKKDKVAMEDKDNPNLLASVRSISQRTTPISHISNFVNNGRLNVPTPTSKNDSDS